MATDTHAMSSMTAAQAAVQQVRAQRDEMLLELTRLTSEECKLPAEWARMTRTVNFVLRSFSAHEIDHLQHLTRLLQARGRLFSEAEMILARAQALRGEMEALLLSLSDADFEASGPQESDWSARQLTDHIRTVDGNYLASIRKARASAPSSAGS